VRKKMSPWIAPGTHLLRGRLACVMLFSCNGALSA
jgi:hypothetical protein